MYESVEALTKQHLTATKDPRGIYEAVMNIAEEPVLRVIVQYANYNQSSAARYLGISRSTLQKKLKKHYGTYRRKQLKKVLETLCLSLQGRAVQYIAESS